MLQDNSFGSSKTSPPMAPFSLDQLGTTISRPSYSSHSHGLSLSSERHVPDRSLDSQPPPLTASNSDPLAFTADTRSTPTIMIRKLPRNTSNEAINAMLLFSEDLISTDIIRSPYLEDHAYTTAIARFKSPNGALEAQAKLHGKSVSTKDARIVVEVQNAGSLERRATTDGTVLRQESGSTSSASSHGAPPPPRSRYGSTFQSTDKISPPLPTPEPVGGSNGFGISDPNHIQNLFSPTSPMSNGLGVNDRFRVSGKSVINNDNLDDDETGELLKDPLAYAKSGQQARRSSHAQPSVSHFSRLSLSTGTNGNHNNFTPPSASHSSTPRGSQTLQPPHSPTNITNMSSGNAFGVYPPRNAYPPINPADQNPPCNTLYVGNLPTDTSEDELKTIFSKQRGYKRLCFRTKHQGPMCFVEFEDISYATKALRDLYGHPLHNSVKGGVRLSYSKNPLGIRNPQNGQPPNGGYPHPLSMGAPGYAINGNGAGGAPNFTAVSGPPPGINGPPGFNNNSNGYSQSAHRESPSAFDHTAFSDPFATPLRNNALPAVTDPFARPGPNAQQNYTDPAGPRNLSGGLPPNFSSGKFGRDSRGSMSNYMFTR